MAFRAASVLFGALFAYAAALQFNDPDPLRWAALYAAAALVSLAAAIRPLPFWIPLGLAALALVWSLTLVPGIVSEASFTGTEEERECVGLLLVAGWTGVVARQKITLSRRTR